MVTNDWSTAQIFKYVKNTKWTYKTHFESPERYNITCNIYRTTDEIFQEILFAKIRLELNITVEVPADIEYSFSDGNYKIGLETFLYLTFCPLPNDIKESDAWRGTLYESYLLGSMKYPLRTIFQAMMNHLKQKLEIKKNLHIIETSLLKHLNEKYLGLETIAFALYSKEDLENKNNFPYLSNHDNKTKKCLSKNKCPNMEENRKILLGKCDSYSELIGK